MLIAKDPYKTLLYNCEFMIYPCSYWTSKLLLVFSKHRNCKILQVITCIKQNPCRDTAENLGLFYIIGIFFFKYNLLCSSHVKIIGIQIIELDSTL